MLILYSTDDAYTARMAIIEYYAIPGKYEIYDVICLSGIWDFGKRGGGILREELCTE